MIATGDDAAIRDRRVPLAVRASAAFAVLGVATSVAGAVAIALLLWLLGIPDRFGAAAGVLLRLSLVYVLASVIVGSVWSTVVQRRATGWLSDADLPSVVQARRVLRLPLVGAAVSATLWLAGTAVAAVATFATVPGWDALGTVLALAQGGAWATGMTYLVAERVVRPVSARALAVVPPGRAPFTVLSRLVAVWLVGSGLPLLNVVFVAGWPTATPEQRLRGAIFLGFASLAGGLLATVLLARGLASPLWRMSRVLRAVGAGRTDVAVGVDDSTELGLLQVAVNDMVRGLREQRRMQDLFGLHVGPEVAAHALRVGAELSGEVREVTALFVDVVDSTGLAGRLRPPELVDRLNRFFATVVESTDEHGGLVNKFVGDGALCVFGAPAPLVDTATAALRAAKQIRDEVCDTGEVDLGIGIARGAAFVGHLGARQRMEYTVIGDPVNEAARLTEHAKQVPGRVLASKAVITAAAPEERAHWRPHSDLLLRGRDAPTPAWTVAAAPPTG